MIAKGHSLSNKASNRKFGLTFSAVFFLIPILFSNYFGKDGLIYLFLISTTFFLFAILLPSVLAPLNKIWFEFGVLLGKISSPVLLSIIFFFVIVPVAIICRFLGRDILRTRTMQNSTYWIDKSPIKPDSFKKQF